MEASEINLRLIDSIADDDPYKGPKSLAIIRWSDRYYSKLLQYMGYKTLNYIMQILNDQECWEPIDSLAEVKLNRVLIGKKLLSIKSESVLSLSDRYQIACYCCLEEEIHTVFTQLKSEISNISVENLVEKLSHSGSALMTYWSHRMHIEEKGDASENERNDSSYLAGFSAAIRDRCVEGLEFFWEKLETIDLPIEQKDELLMDTALYKNWVYGSANVDMIDFCLRHLDPSKYSKLLIKDFEKNNYSTMLNILGDNYFFDRAQVLFKSLIPEDISDDYYSTAIYGLLDRLISTPHHLIKAGYDMLAMIWRSPGYEIHREYFLNKLSHYFASVRSEIIRLMSIGRDDEILTEIVSAMNQKQIERLKKVDKEGYDSLVKYGLLTSHIDNQLEGTSIKKHKLLNDDNSSSNNKMTKYSIVEEDNVKFLGSDSSSALLGEKLLDNIH